MSWKLSDEGIKVRVVVHDRDRKFARSFDRVFEANGARVILTSVPTAAAAFDLPRPAARQSDGQAPLLEDARGWEGY